MYALINPSAPWLKAHIEGFVRQHVPDVVVVDDVGELPPGGAVDGLFQFCDGSSLGRSFAAANAARRSLINAYPNSDALARKDHLAAVVGYWTAKRPGSVLGAHCPHTVPLTLDYAEFVDEALAAADDLSLLASLEQNEAREPRDREWWILKPALVDSGMGIRLFSTVEELASHLELAEYETDGDDDDDYEDDDDNDDDEGDGSEEETKADVRDEQQQPPSLTTPGLQSLDALFTVGRPTATAREERKRNNDTTSTNNQNSTKKNRKPRYVFRAGGRIPSAQMRAFVAQRYVAAVPTLAGGRKWHVRAYAAAVGRLRVYVARDMLVLLAAEPYAAPWEGTTAGGGGGGPGGGPDLRAALTNSAMRDDADVASGRSMRAFWDDDVGEDDPPGAASSSSSSSSWKEDVFGQICAVTGELFRAAAHATPDKFVAVDSSFEVFGLDFLLDTAGNAWLLEVNETPAFYDNPVAGPVALRVLEAVIGTAMEHMGLARVVGSDDPEKLAEVKGRLVEVLDARAELGKSNIAEIIPE
ncbi:hypothetical protein VTH06DRAFT_169 [Thermothelomyces fergusii]